MDLTDSVKNVLGLREQAGHLTVHGEQVVGIGKLYLESGAAAAAAAYANGRSSVAGSDHAELFGAPVDLGAFVAANVAIVLGVTGRHIEDAANFGSGFFNVYLARLFTRMGSSNRIQALTGATPKSIASGVAGGFMGGAPIGRTTQVGGYRQTA